MTDEVLNGAVILLASVTGWGPDTIEDLSVHRFLGYYDAAKAKGLITDGETQP